MNCIIILGVNLAAHALDKLKGSDSECSNPQISRVCPPKLRFKCVSGAAESLRISKVYIFFTLFLCNL